MLGGGLDWEEMREEEKLGGGEGDSVCSHHSLVESLACLSAKFLKQILIFLGEVRAFGQEMGRKLLGFLSCHRTAEVNI